MSLGGGSIRSPRMKAKKETLIRRFRCIFAAQICLINSLGVLMIPHDIFLPQDISQELEDM